MVSNVGERNKVLDIAKGLGMCMIVAYHLIYREQGGLFDDIIRSCIWFIIPFYFVISGYFYKTDYDNRLEVLRYRVIRLFMPAFVTMTVLHLVGGIYFVLVHDYTVMDVIDDYIVTFFRPEFTNAFYYKSITGGWLFFQLSPVWFIWAMIWAYIIFYNVVGTAFSKSSYMIITVVALLVTGTFFTQAFKPLPWSLGMSPIFAVLLMIGALIRKKNIFERILKINPVIALIVSVFCIYVFWLLFKKGGCDNIYAGDFGYFGIITPIVFIGECLICGFAYIFICKLLSKTYGLSSVFSWMGKNSLIILMYHCFFGMFIADALGTYMKPGPNWYLNPLPEEVVFKSFFVFGGGIILSCIMVYVRRKVLFFLIEKNENEYVGHLLDTII